jgi:hypothetical protein
LQLTNQIKNKQGSMIMSKTPIAFISYSHDSQKHIDWVMSLASNLVEKGIDVILNKWSLRPGDDLPVFMEKSLRDADYVLMVCSDKYVIKANDGKGGVGYEKMIVTADYLTDIDNNKVIPIIRQNGTNDTPTFLKSKLYIDLSNTADFEYGFDELCRTILDAPSYQKPKIGTNPYKNMETKVVPPPQPQSSPEAKVLIAMSKLYDSGNKFTDSSQLAIIAKLRRIMTDRILDSLFQKGLVGNSPTGKWYLSEDGKSHILDSELI